MSLLVFRVVIPLVLQADSNVSKKHAVFIFIPGGNIFHCHENLTSQILTVCSMFLQDIKATKASSAKHLLHLVILSNPFQMFVIILVT
jgi:hypothetical protein